MKKTLFVIAALAATAGMGVFGTWVAAQNVTPGAVAPADKPTLKIGIVNLNMVLKEFKKANALGESLIKQAQEQEAVFKNLDEQLRKQGMDAQKITDQAQRDAQMKVLEKQQFDLQGRIVDSKKAFAKMQSDMAVDVYGNLSQVIDSIAKTQKLELVLTYPDITDEKDKNKPADAFRILSNTGAMVAWKHPGLDITGSVIATLNHYFPPPAGLKLMGGPDSK